MTITALSNTLARPIPTPIDRDGICNLGNIEETVFRELAVAEARRSFPAGMTPDDDIRRRAQELVQIMLDDALSRGPGVYSSKVAIAHHHLSEALRK